MSDILQRLHCTIRCDIETAASGCHCAEARDEIARLRADNERLRAALESVDTWLDRWAVHVGRCEGGHRCTCGLTAIRYEVSAAIAVQPAPSGWRPIETAPREPGKYFLGWNGHHCGVIQYWERKYEEDPEWVDEHTEFIDPPISHWMPLPPAPGKEVK